MHNGISWEWDPSLNTKFIYSSYTPCTHMVSRGFYIILLVCLHLPQPFTLGQEWNFPQVNYVTHGSKSWMSEYLRFQIFRWRMCNVDLGLQIKHFHFFICLSWHLKSLDIVGDHESSCLLGISIQLPHRSCYLQKKQGHRTSAIYRGKGTMSSTSSRC